MHGVQSKFHIQLKRARLRAQLPIAEAARLSGVSARAWAYWEKGVRVPLPAKLAITQERLLAVLENHRSISGESGDLLLPG